MQRFFAVLFSWMAFGCLQHKSNESSPTGYYLGGEVKWDSTTFSVCIEPESATSRPNFELLKDVLRDGVVSAYQRAGISFTGWESCKDVQSAHIRVLIQPMLWPVANSIGKGFNNQKNGVFLTFDFLSAQEGTWGATCKRDMNLENCIKNYGLHEFGHSLGLLREADRTGSNCDQGTASPGGILLGTYDPNSIMHYCNNEKLVLENSSPTLSEQDVQGLRSIYSGSAVIASPNTNSANVVSGQNKTGLPSTEPAQTTGQNQWVDAYTGASYPYCVSEASDPDGDSWGSENDATCKVRS